MNNLLTSLRTYVKNERALVLIWVIYSIIFITHSILNHLVFFTGAYDLGIYTQAIYLYSQNKFAFSSIVHNVMMATHFEPILYILAQIYRLFPDPTTLLVIQALMVTTSIFPLSKVIKDITKSSLITINLIICYLSSIGILYAINFDFHTATIAVLPLSIMIYAAYFKKTILYIVSLIALILFKEDLPIFIVGIGLFQLLNKQYRLGVFSILFALTSFYIIQFKITPALTVKEDINSSVVRIKRTPLPLSNPPELIKFLVLNPLYVPQQFTNSPVKINTLISLFSDYGFLPVISIIPVLTIFPYIFIRFTSDYTSLWEIVWHHNANIEPFLVLSAAYGMKTLTEKLKVKPVIVKYICYVMIAAGIIKVLVFPVKAILLRSQEVQKHQYIYNALKIIPKDAKVSAHSPIVPHISNREHVYLFDDTKEGDYIIIDPELAPKAEDIKKKVDQAKGEITKNRLYIVPTDEIIKEHQRKLTETDEWDLILKDKSLTIFKRK